MRISTKRLARRRLKLIEARKEGATFSQLQRRFGVSPNYLSKLFKGKDINKHCEHCGENDPEVLEKHHPDKENRPDYWIWLCSNYHSKVTRKEAKARAKQKAKQQITPTEFPILQKTTTETQVITKPPIPPFEYEKLSKAEKIVFWTTVIGIPVGERTIVYLQKKREKQKYEKLLRAPEFQRELQEVLKVRKEPSSPEQTKQVFYRNSETQETVKLLQKQKSKLEVSASPKKELRTIVYHEKYYKGRPVGIIDQSEYGYTIRDATGKDICVPKSEVRIIKKIKRVDR